MIRKHKKYPNRKLKDFQIKLPNEEKPDLLSKGICPLCELNMTNFYCFNCKTDYKNLQR